MIYGQVRLSRLIGSQILPPIYLPHRGPQRIQRLINGNRATVDPERRQWKWINFIAFWIADSLNIVSISKMMPGTSPMASDTRYRTHG